MSQWSFQVVQLNVSSLTKSNAHDATLNIRVRRYTKKIARLHRLDFFLLFYSATIQNPTSLFVFEVPSFITSYRPVSRVIPEYLTFPYLSGIRHLTSHYILLFLRFGEPCKIECHFGSAIRNFDQNPDNISPAARAHRSFSDEHELTNYR